MTGPSTLLHTDLDLHEVAHLAGGPARVVDTAVAVLAARGLVRVDPAGRLSATRPGTGHPVEAAVLAVLGRRPLRSVATLRWRLADDPAVVAVGERLVAEGLLRRNRLARLHEGWPRLVRTAAGRRLLGQWQSAPPPAVGTPDALAVALRGPAVLGDRVLREALLGVQDGGAASGGPHQSARRRDGHVHVAPYPAWGFTAGDGGGWGGGWGGGDGGCGGGDGGGC
ncbi:TIGR04222 domain-containing membrane protein [Modestobacter sp. URMC 112]